MIPATSEMPTRRSGNKLRIMSGCLKWCVGLVAFLPTVYLCYAVVLFAQFSSNQARWLDAGAIDYSINVKYTVPPDGRSFESLEVVQNGRVTQGRHEFDKPVIDWAFDRAYTCISSWPVCLFFHWSFQYDFTHGYPSHIEYSDEDGIHTIEIEDLTVTQP
jgi:hypothetical protein